MINEGNDLREKKLRGSGGYVLANVIDEEQKKGNLGGPELFLAGVGRLNEDRFSKYYCNKCEKEYEGSPVISYENPNEDLEDSSSPQDHNQSTEVSWDNISKIGDIILVLGKKGEAMPISDSNTDATVTNKSGNKCSSCGYQNQEDAIFCEECGNKLV